MRDRTLVVICLLTAFFAIAGLFLIALAIWRYAAAPMGQFLPWVFPVVLVIALLSIMAAVWIAARPR